MIDWRRYLLYDHRLPWGIVGVLVIVGFLTASGPQPGMNPMQGGQYGSTFSTGYQVGQALFYGFLGVFIGFAVDYGMRRAGTE